MFMMSRPVLSVTDRFASYMLALRNVLFGRSVSHGQPVMMIMLAITYFRRAEGRFQRLIELYRAGKLGPRKPQKPRPKREKPDAEDDDKQKPKRFSQAFGWLAKLIRPDGYYFADQLRETLADPETKAAIAASAQMGRVLRPLCRMFGISDDSIALPKRPRRKPTPTADQLERRKLRAEAKEFADLGKTSSKKSVVPPGHTFPTNERDWAIYWGRVKRADQRRRGSQFKSA